MGKRKSDSGTVIDMKKIDSEKSDPVLIQFDISKVPIDKIFEIERKLHEIGIYFDTGAGFGYRDWQWDFSLSGPVKVTSLKE